MTTPTPIDRPTELREAAAKFVATVVPEGWGVTANDSKDQAKADMMLVVIKFTLEEQFIDAVNQQVAATTAAHKKTLERLRDADSIDWQHEIARLEPKSAEETN